MTTPYYQDATITVHHGDCLDVLGQLPDQSVHAVVTDPPYGLANTDPAHVAETITRWVNGERDYLPGGTGFMGKAWDAFVPPVAVWDECLRVLKPGGHVLAFAGSRTHDLMTLSLRLAGFEIRDSLAWLYGSGFSKGGLLGNRAGVEWCACGGGNAIPYDHASNDDLLGLRNDLHPTPVARGEGQDADVLTAVQREAPGRGVGEARPQGSGSVEPGERGTSGRRDARRSESRLEGRDVHRAGQGLPHGEDAGSPASTSERLRGRSPAGDGVADRAASDASRGGAPHQPGSGGQSAGEPDPLPGPHGALDDGALRGRPECPRCGGLDPAFRGFSTTLKPAFEPIVVARKPLSGTVAGNVLEHGTGALNIDGCRIEGDVPSVPQPKDTRREDGDWSGFLGSGTPGRSGEMSVPHPAGRWPANVILDESQAHELDQQSGQLTSGANPTRRGSDKFRDAYGDFAGQEECTPARGADTGGASRFFYVAREDNESCPNPGVPLDELGSRFTYVAKADASERVRVDGVAHPTVKPLAVMRWLVRLVTPPGGTVLEPFAGSGTTVEACVLEGFDCVAIEREADYLPLIRQRINRRRDPVAAVRDSGDDMGLFGLIDTDEEGPA